MYRGRRAMLDQDADELASGPFRRQVDRWRRALLAAVAFAQVQRLPEVAAARRADQPDRIACAFERQCRLTGIVVDQPHAADRRRRQDPRAIGLVIQADISAHHREVERAAGFRHALDAADELPHDLRALRIAEVHAVGDRQRPRTDRDQVAPCLRHRLLAAFIRIGEAIARRAVGGDRQRLTRPVHPHHRGVAARAL